LRVWPMNTEGKGEPLIHSRRPYVREASRGAHARRTRQAPHSLPTAHASLCSDCDLAKEASDSSLPRKMGHVSATI